MGYKTFPKKIRMPYRLTVAGWPGHIPFTDPSDLRPKLAAVILEGWRRGAIQFEYIGVDQVAKLEAAEALSKVARKQRSDKGFKRMLRRCETRGKKRREGSNVTSAYFVPDTEDEIDAAEGNVISETEDEIEDYSD